MRSQLLEEVLAAPDDDGPRRIFGDYLAERGDPRGELIAVQCELAKASSPELVSREKALLDEHGATWLAELGLPPKVQIAQSIDHPRGSAVVFRRGFPEAAKLAVEDFLPSLARLPLRQLTLVGIGSASASELSQRPKIPSLIELRLRKGQLGGEVLGRLGNSELFSTAAELVLDQLELETIAPLAACALPSLVSLTVKQRTTSGWAALANAPWTPQLRALKLGNVSHYSDLPRWLTSKAWRDLKTLVVDDCLEDVDFAALASSQLATSLEYLETSAGYQFPGAATIAAFTKSRKLGKLKKLVITGVSRHDLGELQSRWGKRLELR